MVKMFYLTVLVFFLAIVEVNAQKKTWSSWQKNNDSPGLHYRYSCSGKVKRSKFYKWEVEFYNDYDSKIEFDAVLINYLGHQVSEEYKVVVLPATIQKRTFFNGTADCRIPVNVKINRVDLNKEKVTQLPAHVFRASYPATDRKKW
jgi:hypothetical protein